MPKFMEDAYGVRGMLSLIALTQQRSSDNDVSVS